MLINVAMQHAFSIVCIGCNVKTLYFVESIRPVELRLATTCVEGDGCLDDALHGRFRLYRRSY